MSLLACLLILAFNWFCAVYIEVDHGYASTQPVPYQRPRQRTKSRSKVHASLHRCVFFEMVLEVGVAILQLWLQHIVLGRKRLLAYLTYVDLKVVTCNLVLCCINVFYLVFCWLWISQKMLKHLYTMQVLAVNLFASFYACTTDRYVGGIMVLGYLFVSMFSGCASR